MALQVRVKELIDLSLKLENEFSSLTDEISGDVFIGCAESNILSIFVKSFKKTLEGNPNIRLNINSGQADYVHDYLEKGLIDFGIVLEPTKKEGFNYELLNYSDSFGILMNASSPYANLSRIPLTDVIQLPLIVANNRLSSIVNLLKDYNVNKLNIVGKYNLVYNAIYMVEEGIGNVISLKNLIHYEGRNLVFIPIVPEIKLSAYVVTKKHTMLSKAAKLVLNNFIKDLNEN